MKYEKGSRIREGKAKILFETERPSPYVIQHFKDDATAFNAQKRGTIRGKGEINNAVSGWIFEHLAAHAIPSHFVASLGERDMLVKRVEIIPVEVVIRNRAAGSLTRRLGIVKGTGFAEPLIEFFFKSDELGDPLIGETHIAHFGWATEPEMAAIKRSAFEVNRILRSVFRQIQLDLVDFKLEYGREPGTNQILLADEFTPDGCRLWDQATQEPMDKDRFRQDLGGVEEAYAEVHRRLKSFFKK